LFELREVVDLLKASPANLPLRDEAASALGQTSQLLVGKSQYQSGLEAMELERVLTPQPSVAQLTRLASTAQKRAEQVEQSLAGANDAERIRRASLIRELLTKAADAQLGMFRKLGSDEKSHVALSAALDLYAKAENFPAAITALELAIAERPDDPRTPELMLRLGQTYATSEASDKAIVVYQQLQSRHPNSIAATRSALLVAQALISKGVSGFVEAEKTLTRLLRSEGEGALKPDSEEFRQASLELAKLHYRTERFDEASARLQDLVAKFPNSDRAAEMHFLAADGLRRSALKSEARLASSSGAQDLTQAAADKKDRLTKARTMFENAIALYHHTPPAPEDTVQRQYEKLSHLYRADCVFELGSYGEAIGLYNEAAARYQQDPASLAAYVQIVNCYCAMGDMDKARTANESAKQMLRRIPPEAFNDGGFVMPKAYWEQWLKWTSTAGAW
jgi:tetratricopeptide (TPR) repeat protein